MPSTMIEGTCIDGQGMESFERWCSQRTEETKNPRVLTKTIIGIIEA